MAPIVAMPVSRSIDDVMFVFPSPSHPTPILFACFLWRPRPNQDRPPLIKTLLGKLNDHAGFALQLDHIQPESFVLFVTCLWLVDSGARTRQRCPVIGIDFRAQLSYLVSLKELYHPEIKLVSRHRE